MKPLNNAPDILNSTEFKSCLERAKLIVATHRAEVPCGFDPKNSFAGVSAGTALAIGAGVSAVGTVAAAALKKKPNMPGFTAVDTAAEQRDAIKQNMLNFQSSQELAQKTTNADQAQLDELLRKAIPGYESIVGQASKNIQADLSGELSSDVTQSIQRSAAAKSLSGGVGGSGVSRNLVARDLGIGSMQLKQQGLNNALNFIQNQRQMAVVNPMSVSSMFLTPAQRINTQMQNSQGQWQAQTAQAQAQNEYDNRWAGAIGSISSSVGGIVSGYGASRMAAGTYSGGGVRWGSGGNSGSFNQNPGGIYQPSQIG